MSRKPHRIAAGLAIVAGVVAVTGCTLPFATSATFPGPVRVRVGKIDADRLEASIARAPATVPEQVEDLFDLFWEVGCAGEHLAISRGEGGGYPEVVCRLPGRSTDTILVVAKLAHEAGGGASDDWASAASLPTLYRALALDQRTHTLVFAGFGQPARRQGAWRRARRMAETLGAKVHAIVDLRDLGLPSDITWSLSADERLREGFSTVGLFLGRSKNSLRLFVPPANSQPSMADPPTIAIGRLAEPDPKGVAAGASPDGNDLAAELRMIAVYLGYVDHTLASVTP